MQWDFHKRFRLLQIRSESILVSRMFGNWNFRQCYCRAFSSMYWCLLKLLIRQTFHFHKDRINLLQLFQRIHSCFPNHTLWLIHYEYKCHIVWIIYSHTQKRNSIMEILPYESLTVAVLIAASSWVFEFESPSMKSMKVPVSFKVTKPAGSRIFIITSIQRIWNLPAF